MTIVSRAAPVAFVAERSRRPRPEHPDPARMIQQGRRVGTGTAYVYRHVVD